MITMKGESVLMTSLHKENKNLIKYIAIGTSSDTPQYTDTSLGAETYRTTANVGYNTNLKALVASADFNVETLEDAAEIGLITNNGDLITHDVFQGIPGGYESTIHLDYQLQLEPFMQVRDWRKTQYTSVYLSLVSNKVLMVYERATNVGYRPVTKLDECINNTASFFYDANTTQLYIHPSTDYVEPVNLNIQVQTR